MSTAVLNREEAKQGAQEKKPRSSRLPLGTEELKKIDAYWRAANYLSVGQIYLYENPLLKEPLTKEHVKPRLLGHWGTTPGLNFIYAHLNRVIKKYDLDMIYIAGPGHGQGRARGAGSARHTEELTAATAARHAAGRGFQLARHATMRTG